MMSKNELKANHNKPAIDAVRLTVGKYDVKERIESKSQLSFTQELSCQGWQI